MKISFIHMQILVNLHASKTKFHMKGFALGLALKQRRNCLLNFSENRNSVSEAHIC